MKILITLILMCISSVAFSCSCKQSTIDEKLARADYVYVGRVFESKLHDKLISSKVEVLQIIQGKPDSNELTSYLDDEGSSCFNVTAVGIRYLIYGKYGQIPMQTRCSDTRAIFGSATEELRDVINKVNNHNQPTR